MRSLPKRLLVVAALGVLLASVVMVWADVVRTVRHPGHGVTSSLEPDAIVWGNRVFRSPSELQRWLHSRGASYSHWRMRFPAEARVLEHRPPLPATTATLTNAVSTAATTEPDSSAATTATSERVEPAATTSIAKRRATPAGPKGVIKRAAAPATVRAVIESTMLWLLVVAAIGVLMALALRADGRALVGRAMRLAARRSVEAITFAVDSIVSAARELDRPETDTGDLVLAAITLCISVGIGMAVASVI